MNKIVKNALLETWNRQTHLRGFVTVTLFVLGETQKLSSSAAKSLVKDVLVQLTSREQNDFREYFYHEVTLSQNVSENVEIAA